MAERAPNDFGADPSNLMRVMPTQGGQPFELFTADYTDENG
jgi:hypothetical protein